LPRRRRADTIAVVIAKSLTDWRSLHGSTFAGARVLITGGAGFIGSHLAQALCLLEGRVVVIDDLNPFSGSSRKNLDGLGEIDFVHASILDTAALKSCTRDCTLVFHEAAMGSVPRSVEDPRYFHEVNATGTLNVLEAARAAGARRVMFAASSSAYGDSPALPKVETMAPQPRSPYAANKVAGEALMAAYSASYGLDTAVLRYFNIFGPRQSASNAYAAVIAAFASALLNGKAPVIYGDGEQSRDFTYVDNVVHANLLAARSARPLDGEPVNVACGKRVSVNELFALMARLTGHADLKADYQAPRTGDVKDSLADLTAATRLLNYRPIVDFPAGLAATVDWYRATH
jgi:nucleoside-diphosphate-sugar epimerase